MDFASDGLYDGRRLQVLTVVDNYTRECLTIEVDQGMGGEKVAGVLGRITMERRVPKTIRVDNVLSLFRRYWISGLIETV